MSLSPVRVKLNFALTQHHLGLLPMPVDYFSARPIVILGAARSGTKLLRTLVGASSATLATPYDMNFVWRWGNERVPHDALPADLATPRVVRFIQQQLAKSAGLKLGDQCTLVEKTVSNVLRVSFIRRVLPGARFVHIVRDGRDVVESSLRCWREPPSAAYLIRKMRRFPFALCLPYAVKHAVRCVGKVFNHAGSVSSWGPRYDGIDGDVKSQPLAYVCSQQWLRCIESFENSRRSLGPSDLYEVRYEDLSLQPEQTALALADWLHLPDPHRVANYARALVTSANVGTHVRLPKQDLETTVRLLGPALLRWRYYDDRLAA